MCMRGGWERITEVGGGWGRGIERGQGGGEKGRSKKNIILTTASSDLKASFFRMGS